MWPIEVPPVWIWLIAHSQFHISLLSLFLQIDSWIEASRSWWGCVLSSDDFCSSLSAAFHVRRLDSVIYWGLQYGNIPILFHFISWNHFCDKSFTHVLFGCPMLKVILKSLILSVCFPSSQDNVQFSVICKGTPTNMFNDFFKFVIVNSMDFKHM